MFLHGGLHNDVLVGAELFCRDEGRGKWFVFSLEMPPQARRIIINAVGGTGAICQSDLTIVIDAENGFDAAGDISCKKRDGTCGCY